MSTPAQIAANIVNAQASTGPRTPEGRAKSSKNSVTLGLFSGDFIRPGEESAYAALRDVLLSELSPVGVLEETCVEEIQRAKWRLRRCGQVESHLIVRLNDGENFIFDPMESFDPNAERIQKSVDRARSQAHRLLYKSTAELRRLQTERHFASEFLPADADASDYGLTDWRSIGRHQARTAIKSPKTPFAQRTQSQPSDTPRNAPCPCGSGQKHKRCCGRNAPAVLQAA